MSSHNDAVLGVRLTSPERQSHSWAGDPADKEPRAVMKYSGDAESVEWFNMAWRKVRGG